jgi:hypothetical protein
MTVSGGSGDGPSFGKVMSGVPRVPVGKVIDEPYRYEFDSLWFTSVLVRAGYRPYLLTRIDNGLRQTLWAQPVVELIRVDRREWAGWKRRVWAQWDERDRYEEVPVVARSIPYERIDMYAQGTVEELPFTEVKAIGVVVLLAEDDGEIVNELGHVKELAFA